tara:strand:+ start:4096 stop:8022 length:3927 start_codon:yes stop_codon:yes gene_type:complete
MTSVFDVDKTSVNKENITLGPPGDEDVSGIGSFMAGIGSGLFKIPEGVVSLGATLLDLGAGTETATEVEEFFAKINPFDEYAAQTTAGKLSELLVNLAVPAGFAVKTAGKLADVAIAGKKGGKYLKFGAQAGAAGVTDAVVVADVEEIGTFGDLYDGFTAIDRESDNPQTELLNRLKFGTEGGLFTAGLSGIFSGAKKLAKEGTKLRTSNSKFDRWLDKFASKLRARGDKDADFFDLENLSTGARAADINAAENFGFTIQKHMDSIFPLIKRTGDQLPDVKRAQLTDEMGEVLLSGKPNSELLKKGQVIFEEMDQVRWNSLKDKLLKKGMTEEAAEEIYTQMSKMRSTWGTLFSGLGKRLDPKSLKQFSEVMGDKWKNYLDTNYKLFQNKSFIPALNYKPATAAVDKLKSVFMEAKPGLNSIEAENLVSDIYKNASLPAGFNLNRSSDVIFNLPDFAAKTVLQDASKFKGIANMSELTPEMKILFEDLFGKDKSALQTILNGTSKLSLITRRNQFLDELVKKSDERVAAGLKPMLANSREEAVTLFKDDFRQIQMDPGKKLAAGGVDINKLSAAQKEALQSEIAEGITNPLNGKFAINGVADALEETSQNLGAKSIVGKMYENFILYPKATSQIAKTILSPITHVRNFISAGAFATANGIIPGVTLTPAMMKESFSALQTGLKGTRQQNDLYQKLLRLGVVNSQVQVGDLVRLMEDVKFGQSFNSYTGLQKLLERPRKFMKASQEYYTAEDDFWKIGSWVAESNRLEKAFAAKGLTRGSFFKDAAGKNIKLTQEYFEEQAASIVRNNIPNYSYVSEFVKGLRKLPLGNFISFPAEIMRTSTNIVKRGLDEIAYSATLADGTTINPLASIGYKRLAGMAATTLAVPYAAVEGAKALYNVTEDEMDALRRFVPEWSKNSTLIPIRDKETGNLKYIDFSHLNAYDTITRPLQTVLNKVGQGETDMDGVMDDFLLGMIESTKELGAPFVTESIWTEALVDVAPVLGRSGRSKEGIQVWNNEDTLGDKVSKGVKHLFESQVPLNAKQIKRMILATKDDDDPARFDKRGNEYELPNELLGIAGLRAVNVDPAKGIIYKISELQKRERLAKDIFKRNTLRGGIVTPEEIVDSYIKSNNALFKVKNNFSKDYEAALELGIPIESLENQMKRLSKRERNDIVDGVFRPYSPSQDIIRKFEENSMKLGVSNPWIQAESVIDGIKTLIEQAPLSLENLPEIENPFRIEQKDEVTIDSVAGLNNIIGGEILNQNYVDPGNQINTNQVQGVTPFQNQNLDQKIASGKKAGFNKPGDITFGS